MHRQGLTTCQAAVGVRTLSTVVRYPPKKEFGGKHECYETTDQTHAGKDWKGWGSG